MRNGYADKCADVTMCQACNITFNTKIVEDEVNEFLLIYTWGYWS